MQPVNILGEYDERTSSASNTDVMAPVMVAYGIGPIFHVLYGEASHTSLTLLQHFNGNIMQDTAVILNTDSGCIVSMAGPPNISGRKQY